MNEYNHQSKYTCNFCMCIFFVEIRATLAEFKQENGDRLKRIRNQKKICTFIERKKMLKS